MPQTDLGPNKWALIHARREEDLASGLVPHEERPGFAAAVLGESGWTKIYHEIKHYDVNEKPSDVCVFFDEAQTRAVKLDDGGALIDQASALVRLRRQFGVRIPSELTIVTDNGVTLLVMEKMEIATGHCVQKTYRAIARDAQPADGESWTRSGYKSVYEQGKGVALACTELLVQLPFDVIGLHKGNWGVRPSLLSEKFQADRKLEASDVVIFDPVSMRYAWPPTVVKSRS
ncbi:MAG TPA: hypothetical protein V6C81_27220 [Planktothrix sp.]|jgi:hypothetical protein